MSCPDIENIVYTRPVDQVGYKSHKIRFNLSKMW